MVAPSARTLVRDDCRALLVQNRALDSGWTFNADEYIHRAPWYPISPAGRWIALAAFSILPMFLITVSTGSQSNHLPETKTGGWPRACHLNQGGCSIK
jgi:hypothetical protein